MRINTKRFHDPTKYGLIKKNVPLITILDLNECEMKRIRVFVSVELRNIFACASVINRLLHNY